MHTTRLSRAARVALLGLALSALGGLGLVALASAHDRPGQGVPADAPPLPPGPPVLLGLPSGGPALGRLLDEAGASAEQRARIEQLLAPVRTPAAAAWAQDRADRERLQALFQAPVVDGQAVEALRAGMAQRHEAAARQHLAALVAAANVLSPSQRQQVAAHWPPARDARHDGPPPEGPGRAGPPPAAPADAGVSPSR